MTSWYIVFKIGSLTLENLQNSLKLVAILNEKKFDVQLAVARQTWMSAVKIKWWSSLEIPDLPRKK